MADLTITAGDTNRIVDVNIQNTTTGAAQTGLVYNSTSLIAYYKREGFAPVAISLVAGTQAVWSSGGFVEISSTNAPGTYELGVPNAAFAPGAKSVSVYVSGYAGTIPVSKTFQLSIYPQ